MCSACLVSLGESAGGLPNDAYLIGFHRKAFAGTPALEMDCIVCFLGVPTNPEYQGNPRAKLNDLASVKDNVNFTATELEAMPQ